MSGFNVLQLMTDSKIGGAERIVVTLAKGLNKDKFNVHVCCLAKRGPILEEMEAAGIKVYSLGMRNKWDFFKMFNLVKILKTQNIHILHSHLFHANILGRIIGRLSGVPIIISCEHTMGLEGKLRIILNRISSVFSDKIISVSYAVGDFLIRNAKINPLKLVVIQNGIDCSLFNINNIRDDKSLAEFGFTREDRIIGTITHIYKNKGIEYFLQAIKEVSGALPDTRFLIVGDGPLKRKMQKLSERLGIQDKVIFTGFRKDTVRILANINIFVHPSLFEGLPITILEAMAMKRPVIATKVGGIVEVVENGVTGILVEPKNPRSLSEAILRLLNDTLFMDRLGEAGYKRVSEYFNSARMVREVEDLYDRLIADKIKC